MKPSVLAASLLLAGSAGAAPFTWDNATVYFLLTDRFNNASTANDHAYGRGSAAPLRGFMGGDLKGVTAKIRAGYFKDLGVDALWITPPVEQIHASTDEGTGESYGFHGYWAKDFTAVDAALGTEADLRELVATAHQHGLRVLLDVVMNQIGPVTAQDPVWPADWVRTAPRCDFKTAATTIECTLVANLPDLRTESATEVALPPPLVEKWKQEGRYDSEVASLDAFFKRTGYPRTPRYHLVKWHTDYVRKFGFDGFRADTVKHVEPDAWRALKKEAALAYEDWKRANPKEKLGDQPFYMTAEAYGYAPQMGLDFNLGDKSFNYYDAGFDSMINFAMKGDAAKSYEQLFSEYSAILNGPLKGHSILNYISSHDDGGPFDQLRTKPFEAGTKLLLAPGAAQIYYGDETARLLKIEGAQGDATLRSFMNWDELAKNVQRNGYRIGEVRQHFALLGRFRHDHPAIGAGVHAKLADQPYTFKRTLDRDGLRDQVVIALDAPKGAKISVGGVFADGTRVTDGYTGQHAVVRKGQVSFARSGRVTLIAAD
ncbi:alpha-amlyase [Massilia arenosa]|uniref:Alpha-amlyase n=1 Tax=Zemynaea arenosa TaxID=2561931 RepID=A0A4Y9SB28_9BURK|nr:alpha-amylase family glycosyl hydrolase [Massilia arenosa]TFW17816.1 alpha-amlyase [Massilia arenosa]